MASKIYVETCADCKGTGKWRSYSTCRPCKGDGVRSFKSSPEQRAARNAANEIKREQKAIANLGGFEANHPVIAAWWNGEYASEFALSLRGTATRKGVLSVAQFAEATKQAENEAKWMQEAIDRQVAVHDNSINDLVKAFRTALRNGIKSPSVRLWIDGHDLNFFPAKMHSANAGYIHAKDGETYLGKIGFGLFRPTRECNAALAALVIRAIEIPVSFALDHARETGNCPLCVGKGRGEGMHADCFKKFFLPFTKDQNA